MARTAAWTMLIIGLILRIGDEAFQWIVHSPWSGARPYPSGIFELVVLWFEAYSLIPFLGAWLLGEARVHGGGLVQWRWWVGAILFATVLSNFSDWNLLGGEYPAQYLGYTLANCLPLWPIWYLTSHRRRLPRPVAAKSDG